MRRYSFSLKTPSHLLAKLRRDFERLKSSQELHQSDHAFNFAIAAWHMTDWVWKTTTDAQTRFARSTLGTFQQMICDESEAIRLCKDLAEGSKHFAVDKPDARAVVDSNVSATGAVLGAFTLGHDKLGEEVLKIRLADGTSKRAEEVFAEALAYWKQFFHKYGVSA